MIIHYHIRYESKHESIGSLRDHQNIFARTLFLLYPVRVQDHPLQGKRLIPVLIFNSLFLCLHYIQKKSISIYSGKNSESVFNICRWVLIVL